MNIKDIEALVETRKAGYKADDNSILSNYNHEQETVEDYNGRQLLELLQNADDAKSDEVLITLDKTNNLLRIANKGKKCEPFTVEGVESIMYPNFSSKTDNNTIGFYYLNDL